MKKQECVPTSFQADYPQSNHRDSTTIAFAGRRVWPHGKSTVIRPVIPSVISTMILLVRLIHPFLMMILSTIEPEIRLILSRVYRQLWS